MQYLVRVWDLPTRLFHWSLAACVIALVVTAKVGGEAMVWHFRLGYAVLALLAFRLVWGLVGGHWSRFANFIYSPASVLRYLRGQGEPAHSVGHTPLGAGSVFALLLVLTVQVGSGLISDDEISFAGPLTRFVPNATVSLATWYHKAVGQWLVIGLVVLHLVAIAFYVWRKKQLVKPMLVGDKVLDHPEQSSRDDAVARIAAVLVIGLAAAGTAWLVSLGG
jgi:cytochrome b